MFETPGGFMSRYELMRLQAEHRSFADLTYFWLKLIVIKSWKEWKLNLIKWHKQQADCKVTVSWLQADCKLIRSILDAQW